MDGVTRRMFLVGGAGAVVLLAFGGVTKYAFGEAAVLRPPGGQDEDHFIANCIKCDRCRSACPLNCISVATTGDGLLRARTPKLDFHLGYCDFCGLCIANCPTGALKPFDPALEWIAPAVIDTGLCIAYQYEGSGCKRCVDRCPFDALTNDSAGRPVVETDRCNGCGYCEYVCPSNTYRVVSDNRRRAISVTPTERSRNSAAAGAASS
jgi:ferredoxin-type protein NapG